jgi:hypothetical protein
VTVISTILTDAYRECNMIPLGKALTEPQTTEALRLLNNTFKSVYGGDAGESLQDWPLGNYGRQSLEMLNYTERQITNPPINFRMLVLNEVALTVYLTVRPQDGARMSIADPYSRLADVPVTLNANGRTIEGTPTILLDTDGTFREWLYRADLGDWVRVIGKGYRQGC